MIDATVWVFVGEGARFPSGVFASVVEAEAWIGLHGLTGVLTEYPVGEGVYDVAVQAGRSFPRGKSSVRLNSSVGFPAPAKRIFTTRAAAMRPSGPASPNLSLEPTRVGEPPLAAQLRR